MVIGHRRCTAFRLVGHDQTGETLVTQLLQPHWAVAEAPVEVGWAGGEIPPHLFVHLAGVGEAVTKHHDPGKRLASLCRLRG